MVEGGKVPIIIAHWCAGRALQRIGPVMDHIAHHIDDRIFPDGDLHRPTFGMLDQIDGLTDQDFARLPDQRQPAAPGQCLARQTFRPNGHKGEIQNLIGEKECGRIEGEGCWHTEAAVSMFHEIKFDHGVFRRSAVAQHVVIGHHKAWGHQEAGTKAFGAGIRSAHHNAPDKPGRAGAAGQEIHRLDLAGLEDAFQHHAAACGAGALGANHRVDGRTRQALAGQTVANAGLVLRVRPIALTDQRVFLVAHGFALFVAFRGSPPQGPPPLQDNAHGSSRSSRDKMA